MSFPPLRLKKDEERRLRAGHAWVFSNEIDVAATPLVAFEPGDPVTILSHRGGPLGTGYVNPRSLIAARLCSRDAAHPWGPETIVARVRQALALRERIFARPFYRLVYGESDGLPGLVVDRYDDVLVAQFTTAGIERMRAAVLDALLQVLAPRAIWLRNETAVRRFEGLELVTEVAHGDMPDELTVEEGGLRYAIPLAAAQKTGWFHDQRDNRARLGRYARGARVLDVFAYAGAWGLAAAAAGAAEVTCVDASSSAIDMVRRHAAANGLAVSAEAGDAFDVLEGAHGSGRRFDIVIVDPPAFIKRRRDQRQGLRAYHRLNRLALQLLAPDGLLVSCSCSQHLGEADLVGVLRQEALELRRDACIVEIGGQGPDHPIHPAIPETRYLTCLFVRVTGSPAS